MDFTLNTYVGDVRKLLNELTEDERNKIADAGDKFKEYNPKKRRILLELDFLVPLIKSFRK